jgi:phage tail sheath protein FI
MPNYVSPGVYTIEKDISEYTPSINTSIVGIVGFASKGPTNKATLITSQNNLIDTFGYPSENITGQALEGALEILEQTNSLYFIRAADSTAVDASASITLGTCPAFIVSGLTTFSTGNGFGVGRPLTLRIQVYDNNGVAKFTQNSGAGKDFVIPAGTAQSQAAALRAIIGGGLDSDLVGVFDDNTGIGSTATGLALSGAIVAAYAGSGASMGVSACTGTTFSEAAGVSALRAIHPVSSTGATYGVSGAYASALRVFGATYVTTGTTGASYLTETIYPGAGYNTGTTIFGLTSGNSVSVENLGSQNFIISVNEDGTAKETFKASMVASGSFLEDIINTGDTNRTSDVIKGNLNKGGSDATASRLNNFAGTLASLLGTTNFTAGVRFLDPITAFNGVGTPATSVNVTTDGGRFIKPVEGTYNLAGGTNGDTAANISSTLIGTSTGDTKTGIQALDDPTLNIGIALVPGVHTASVQNALITLAESTQDFIALVSPPYAIGSVQNAIDWTNGKSSTTANSRTSAISSSFAAVYWPWVKVFSTYDGKDRWYDPAIFGARQMAYTDGVAESWIAPAGFVRGRLTKPTEVEVKLNQGDRDSLYSGGNVINPIVSFPQQGITIFGQRTAQRTPSALDRINVRRLMIYIRKVILASTQRFVFEPNDEFTWAQIEASINPLLDDIRRRRGITEFRVVCDETVNTPIRVDRNELWTRILVKPTKTAEILIFEINLTNQSADLGTV